MKRSTINIIQGSASSVIEAKLGDIFFINSNLKAYNNNELSEFRPVVSMLIAIRQPDKRTWLFSACVDHSQYAISKIDKDKISLISGRKQTTLNIDDIKNILLTKTFPTKILGIRMYGVIISTGEKLMSQMDMIKVNTRMPDVSKWPVKSIDIWAKRQHNLSNQELVKIVENVDNSDFDGFVNSIILAGVVKKWQSIQIKKKEKNSNAISEKITSIVGQLARMRIWRAFNTRFIKVHMEEIDGGNIVFSNDINPEDMLYYSVLVIRDLPSYIVVKDDEDSDTGISFIFINGTKLRCRLQIFNIESFRQADKRAKDALLLDRFALNITPDEVTHNPMPIAVSDPDEELRTETIEVPSPSTNNNLGIGTTDLRFENTELVINTSQSILQNATFTTNSEQPTPAVSVDANGVWSRARIDTTELAASIMGQAPSEAEEPEVRDDRVGTRGYLQYNPIDPVDPEVATEEEEE